MKPLTYPGAKNPQQPPQDEHVLEEVWWWDHYTRPEAGPPQDTQAMLDHPPLLMRSVGWVVGESDGQVVLAQTLSHYNDGEVQRHDGRWVILKAEVVARWEIR